MTDHLICSICGNPIPDMCQAHYLEGPVCNLCLNFQLQDTPYRKRYPHPFVKASLPCLLDGPTDRKEPDWATVGCW